MMKRSLLIGTAERGQIEEMIAVEVAKGWELISGPGFNMDYGEWQARLERPLYCTVHKCDADAVTEGRPYNYPAVWKGNQYPACKEHTMEDDSELRNMMSDPYYDPAKIAAWAERIQAMQEDDDD